MEATFDVINEAKSIFNKEMEALVLSLIHI